jgi:hypothetical protein
MGINLGHLGEPHALLIRSTTRTNILSHSLYPISVLIVHRSVAHHPQDPETVLAVRYWSIVSLSRLCWGIQGDVDDLVSAN